MSVFNKIGRFFVTAKVKAAAAFKTVFGEAASDEAATVLHDLFLTEAGKAAKAAVEYAQSFAVTDTEKRTIAQQHLTETLKENGSDVEESLKNLLIELAVNFIKGRVAV